MHKSGRRSYQTDGYANFVFCTRQCEQGANIKTIQNMIGDKNITVTLDVYAKAAQERKAASFAELYGMIKL